jgi:amidase
MIPWEPPSHAESSKIHVWNPVAPGTETIKWLITCEQPSFTEADGAADVFHNIDLSGEPLIPELQKGFGTGPTEPTPLLDFYKNSLKLKDYRARYNSYWTSTMEQTGTGRPADAVIMPVAPHAAVIPRHYFHYSKLNLIPSS